MKYIRGWIGLFIFLVGVGMLFFEKTKWGAYFGIGFGMGMMTTGFRG